MKRLLLFLLLAGSFSSQAQNVIGNNLTARNTVRLYDWTINRIQRDTNFTSHTSIPTSLAVRNFVEGRLADFATGSETDPVWNAASANYYTKVQSDARYLQSFTEADPTVNTLIKNIPIGADASTNKFYYWNNGDIQRRTLVPADIQVSGSGYFLGRSGEALGGGAAQELHPSLNFRFTGNTVDAVVTAGYGLNYHTAGKLKFSGTAIGSVTLDDVNDEIDIVLNNPDLSGYVTTTALSDSLLLYGFRTDNTLYARYDPANPNKVDTLGVNTDVVALRDWVYEKLDSLAGAGEAGYTDEMAQDAGATMIQNGTGINWTYNDASNTLTPTVSLSAFTTDNLAQGSTNKYYATSLFNSDLATKTTDNLSEGSTNKYFSNALARAAVSLNFTTTGTSGAATGSYNNITGVLTINVPNYSVGGGSDGNDYVDGVSFNTADGVLTLTRTGALADLTADLDGRYLTSYTETDPVFVAHAANGITSTNISNWNTAHGWGNHASAGYLTNITGKISQGTNVTITGTGTSGDPYVINSSGGSGGVTDHGALTGLTDDDHTQYLLLAGRSGGQTLTVNNTDFFKVLNNQDAASVQGLRVDGDRATVAANDEIYNSFYLSDDAGTQTEFGRITFVATDVAAATKDGQLDLSVMLNGTLAKEVSLSPTAFFPTTNDGSALGTSSNMWADLYLASGGVIRFNNSDVTITHASNQLTISGADNGIFHANDFVPTTPNARWFGSFSAGYAAFVLGASGVLYFGGNDVSMTHSSNLVTLAGGDFAVPTEVYGAGWNGNNEVPTKDALYDKIETLQPLDAGLTSIGGAATTNTFYYLSAADTWSPVTIGNNLDFTSGTLSAVLGTSQIANLNSQYADVGNVGTGEDNLLTYTMSANTLVSNGDWLEYECSYEFVSGSANNKTIKFYFGATAISMPVNASTTGGGATLKGKIIRTGASTCRITYSFLTVSGDVIHAGVEEGTSLDFTSTIVIKSTGEATANDDIVQRSMQITYHAYTP
jgi:hypothetical protein